MKIELEYRAEDDRWYWRVLFPDSRPRVVRAGLARERDEADNQASIAAGEYRERKVYEA